MKGNRFYLIFAALLFAAAFTFAQSKPDALKLYNEGSFKEAIEICEAEIKANPGNLDSYVVLCWALVANHQYGEAEIRATEARKLNNYDSRLIEVLGEAKYFLGKNNEALVLFQRFVSSVQENAPRYGRVYYYMGEIFIKQARYEHADIALTTAVRSEPQRDYWWTRLGYAREMTKDWKSAIAAYDQALVLNRTQYDAQRGKERCQTHIQ